MSDLEFLTLLVHRKHLAREHAEPLVPRLKGGEELDVLLAEVVGWDGAKIERLRRTRAGERPEIPGFEIQATAGVGGTASVFRAREKKTGRTLALKVLSAECTRNAAVRRAFVDEARLLEKLSHESLVKGLGVARSGSTYFMKLEYIEGSTLLELLDAGQAFGEEAALRIVLEVAEVLSYLESEELVHRDIKPGNIMISQDGRVKLIDLGFAAGVGVCGEDESSTSGTVAYLSPEQSRGGAAADSRSDIYSLGISLFHLVVGRLPFEGSDDREVLRMQVMESLSSPELKSRGLSPHLHYFIEKMMAKEAEHRYQSWRELIEDVRAQLAGREDLDFARGARRRRGR